MTDTSYPKANAHADQQRGFSLVELMVAVALLAVLMAGLVELFVSNSRNANATASLSRIQETGRTALQLLTADIRRAGYFGGNAVSDFEGSLGEAASASACVSGTTTWGRMVGQPTFGVNDVKPSTVGYTCIADSEYLRGDVLTVRYTPSQSVLAGAMVAKMPYIKASVVEGKIFAGEDEADAENQVIDLGARNYVLAAHTYYIGPTGRSCQGVAIPALFRKSIGTTGLPVSSELVAGVEHMQFKYQVGNQYVDANDIAIAGWDTVNAVEPTLLVRSECPENGFVNDRTFAMGDLGAAYGPTDGFRRQVYTSLSWVRN